MENMKLIQLCLPADVQVLQGPSEAVALMDLLLCLFHVAPSATWPDVCAAIAHYMRWQRFCKKYGWACDCVFLVY